MKPWFPGLRSATLVLFIAPFLLAFSGCGSHDDEASPGSGASHDPGGQSEAQSTGVNMLDLIIEVTELLPAWRDGQLGGIAPERTLTPVWNASERTWVFGDSLVVASPEVTILNRYTYSVQYWHDRIAGPDHEGADEMWVAVNLLQSGHSQSDPGAPESYTTDYSYSYIVQVHLSELLSADPQYAGSGVLDGRFDLVSPGASAHRTIYGTYSLLLQLGSGWCPTGIVAVHLDPYTFYGAFDGDDTVPWRLNRNEVELSHGERPIHCPGRD